MYNYIGIDVSKKVIHVFNGKKNLKFKNESLLPDFTEWLNEQEYDLGNLVIIFEPTGIYSENLRFYCARRNIKVYMVNPKMSSHFAKALGNRKKTDKIDAKMLYKIHKIIPKGKIEVPNLDKHALILHNHITMYEFAVKNRISISNHIEGTKKNIKENKFLYGLLDKQLENAKYTEETILKEMENYVKKDEDLNQDFENLTTIPGIGIKSAIYLIAFFKAYSNTNRSQITALAGLDVTEKSSGTSVYGKSKISKNGNSSIRTMLYLPTINATRNNKKIARVYNRLLENNKKKKVAIIACMRKLLLLSHAMYKNKTVFQEGYNN